MNKTLISRRKYLLIFVVVYLGVYCIASWMDLATTALGLAKPGVSEKNVFVIIGDGYSPKNAWLLTVAGAIIMTTCILDSFRNSQRVEKQWLERPIRSFGKLYINPWSENAIGFTPIHFLSLALAFPLFRVLAALNNLGIYWFDIGPLGKLMELVASRTNPLAGFTIVGFLFFGLLTLAVSPFASKIISAWKSIGG